MELLFLTIVEAAVLGDFLRSAEFEMLRESFHEQLVDFTFSVEIQFWKTPPYMLEWMQMVLVGAQWKALLHTVLTLSQLMHWRIFAFVGVLVTFIWVCCRHRTRLGLSCKRRRKQKIQTRKRWNGHLRRQLNICQHQKKGIRFLLLLSLGYGTQAMDGQLFGQRFQQFLRGIGTLLHQQDQVLQQVAGSNRDTASASASTATASVAKSLESAARILKPPEIFDSSDAMAWVTWRHSFLNWLSYTDSRFLDNILQVEKLSPSDSVETVDWDTAEWDLARKLYAILTSYLKGTALQLSRSGSKERNGYALWKILIDHFAPATRQRASARAELYRSTSWGWRRWFSNTIHCVPNLSTERCYLEC